MVEPTFDPVRRLSKRDRLERIVTAHQPVYDLLNQLAEEGSYVRSIGNHDSYLWEDADVRAWRQANDFPAVEGGFVIDDVKTLEDFGPTSGSTPPTTRRPSRCCWSTATTTTSGTATMHNRLGKFIANAVGVLVDALDSLIYDWRGVDMTGHPLVEIRDVLAPITPFDNWPPREIARTWAEAIEQRRPLENLTQDSIMFSETFAAVMAMLMRSGPRFPEDWSVLLCVGHTHNPHSRPWVPYLAKLNPLRTFEIFGLRPFENFVWPKTRYLNSGTVGWWENLIWAIEVTEEGQPRLVYWSGEDSEPVTMDWELHDQEEQVPSASQGLDRLVLWARDYLHDQPAAALAESATSTQAESAVESEPMARIREWSRPTSPLSSGLSPSCSRPRQARMAGSTRLSARSGASALLDDPLRLATAVLAGRGEPALRGADPRSLPRRLARGSSPVGGPRRRAPRTDLLGG